MLKFVIKGPVFSANRCDELAAPLFLKSLDILPGRFDYVT
jgi:hypothetical protein